MVKPCDCGRVIEQPATGRRRTKCLVCSPSRDRSARRAPALGIVGAPSRQKQEPTGRLTIAASTLGDLRRVDRHETTAGITALHLAELLDAGGYNAQGAASLVKAHREALALALEGTAPTADVIDVIFGSG